MSPVDVFPSLTGWEPTRDTLKWYSRAAGVIPRTHAPSHPKWWHISLAVQPDGLVTERMTAPDGGEFWIKVDLNDHVLALVTSEGARREIDMRAGLTATELGDRLIDIVADLGLEGDYAREKFTNEDLRQYDPEMATRYRDTIVLADRTLKRHRSGLDGELGPVQLWPHGFDLAFEWFGTRMVEHEEDGEVEEIPAQVNFGFSPGEPNHPDPYFYANPWPFEESRLVHHPLPSGARWFTEGWEGTLLAYEDLVGDPNGVERLLAYYRAVFAVSRPTLTA